MTHNTTDIQVSIKTKKQGSHAEYCGVAFTRRTDHDHSENYFFSVYGPGS